MCDVTETEKNTGFAYQVCLLQEKKENFYKVGCYVNVPLFVRFNAFECSLYSSLSVGNCCVYFKTCFLFRFHNITYFYNNKLTRTLKKV